MEVTKALLPKFVPGLHDSVPSNLAGGRCN
jgi:hypothetical protein